MGLHLKQMRRTSKYDLNLEKWVTLGKKGSHLEKWIKLEETSHTWQKESHLEKGVILGKRGHTWKIASRSEKWVTLKKIRSHLEKWVTLGNMGNIGSQSEKKKWEKYVTLEKGGHTRKNVSHMDKRSHLE